MPSTEAGKRLLRAMHSEGLFEDELLAEVEREAALNQHLDECEGRCMCGAREHRGECHFGWHKDGCPDAPKVNMDDYMAGYRQGQADGINAETLAAALHDARFYCWTNREDVCTADHGEGARQLLAALRGDTDA